MPPANRQTLASIAPALPYTLADTQTFAQSQSSISLRCVGKFKVLKYSYMHDSRPTPDGLSSQPVDPFEWSHLTANGLLLRVFRIEPEGLGPPLARIAMTKGTGRTYMIMEDIDLQQLARKFDTCSSAGIARDPVLGFRYLVQNGDDLMTFRFQVRLGDTVEFDRACTLLQRMGCSLTILQPKRPLAATSLSEQNSQPPPPVAVASETSVSETNTYEESAPIFLEATSKSSEAQSLPDSSTHSTIEVPQPRLSSRSLLYQTQIQSEQEPSTLDHMSPHIQQSPVLDTTFSVARVSVSVGRTCSDTQESLSSVPNLIEGQSQPRMQFDELPVFSGQPQHSNREYTTINELESPAHEAISKPQSTCIASGSQESRKLRTLSPSKLTEGAPIFQLADQTVLPIERAKPSAATEQQNFVQIGGSIFSLVPVSSVPQPADQNNNIDSYQTSAQLPKNLSAQSLEIQSIPALQPSQDLSVLRKSQPLQNLPTPLPSQPETTDFDPLGSSQDISTLVHSSLANASASLTSRMSRNKMVQQRIRQAINEPDFWKLVCELEKQWKCLSDGI